ncbi:hypothetical protein [Lysobacter olei]
MTRVLTLMAFVALAGCSAQPDTPIPTEPASEERSTPVAPEASAPPSPGAPGSDTPPPPATPPVSDPPSPPGPPSSTGVPPRFQGTYALDDKACAQPGHESRLVLSDARIQFHESSGPIEQVQVDGDTLGINARVTGEGETRQAVYRFALSADGRHLRDLEHGMVRVRCP